MAMCETGSGEWCGAEKRTIAGLASPLRMLGNPLL
jgi:hypothetical protein